MITLEKAIPIRCFDWCAIANGIIVNAIVVNAIVLGETDSAVAQQRPIADDTLGNESTTVIELSEFDLIDGGARRGDNLFHSFREFHVDEGRSVYFDNPNVDNIVARVTGGVESQILGVLGVRSGDANLFLINPNGIIFGSNARLDVGGSFVATTADAIGFGEQGFFSAIDPTVPPLLTIQPTAALFNQLNPASIANGSFAPATENRSGSPEFGLQVPEGESLTLLGGNIRMDGGGLIALGGRVEIGGLSEPGTVRFNADGSLSFPAGVARSNLLLINDARINTIDVATNGGSIRVNVNELEMIDSSLSAGIAANSGAVGVQAGDITLNARVIRASAFATIDNLVGVGGVGSSGDIRINAGSFSLTSGAQLSTSTFGQGNAGNVFLNVGEITLNDGNAFTSVNSSGVGNSGNIYVHTDSLLLTNRAELSASTLGQGNAGNVIITARDRISLDNGNIFTSVNLRGVGVGGNIRIRTDSLLLANGAELSASTVGQGRAGSVFLNVRDRIALDDGNVFTRVNSGGVGAGGDIRIRADSLLLTDRAELTTSTFGQGRAGNVFVNVRDRVVIEESRRAGSQTFQSGIFTTTGADAQGRGGDVTIAADSIRIADSAVISTETENRFSGGTVTFNANRFEATAGGQVVTATSGEGQAGDIIINARDRITLSGENPFDLIGNQGTASGLFANTTPNSAGEGGTVELATGQLQVFDRARIEVDSDGSGVAGDIDITAAGVQLDSQARLSAETDATDGGDIQLRDVAILQLSNNSLISTTAGTAQAGGNGGNIDIDADFIIALPNDNSDIRADAFRGNGGNVRITTEGLFGIAVQPQDNPFTSDITASSRQGVQGTVNITTPDVDPRRGLTELPVEVVDASSQITQTCGATGAGSEFVVTGRGGVPTSPIDPLVGDESLSDWSSLDEPATAVASQFPERVIAPPDREIDAAPAGAIVEAQGWVVAEDGTVRLIAAAPASATQPPATCQASTNR